MSALHTSSIGVKSSISAESLISNGIGSTFVELELPFGRDSLLQHIENDEIIHRAIQG